MFGRQIIKPDPGRKPLHDNVHDRSGRWQSFQLRVLLPSALLLLSPFGVSWMATLVSGHSPIAWPEAWLRMAQYGLLGVGFCMFAVTFLIERTFRKAAAHLRARQRDPQVLIFQATTATAVCPSSMAFLLSLVGGSVTAVYLWASASLLVASFWCIRYRRVMGEGRGADSTS
jgi:hypothetical protein